MGSCFFIGHRETPDQVYPALLETIEHHITEYGVAEFVVGQYGNFDRLVIRALSQAKRAHPDITLMLMTPYYPVNRKVDLPEAFDALFYPPDLETVPKRLAIIRANRYMVERSDFLIAYVRHPASNAKELLEYAAYAESYSSHPISKSLKNAYGKELDASNVSDVEEISGHGVTAKVNGRQVAAGNAKLMKSLNLAYTENTGVGTVVHVAVDGNYAGYILISDVIKDGAKEAIASLKNSGVKKCVMLTGDSKTVAEHVAGELKLDEVHSELLPADKVSCVEKLLQEKGAKEKLAFVGDGINDAPVLSRADIGIAMGALGSDAAIEAADVVLMDDNPAKIALAMRISRKCLRIVYENIVFALAVKAICLILGALGIANMWVAIFADVGVMVLAVLNAIRCLRIKNN